MLSTMAIFIFPCELSKSLSELFLVTNRMKCVLSRFRDNKLASCVVQMTACRTNALVREDRHIKVTDITQELGTAWCGLHSVVHDHLDYRKLHAGSQRTSHTITKLIIQDSVLSI